MLLPKLPFTVLDTETTGFIPKVNRVIEFASMQAKDGTVVDTYECLINIPTTIPREVVTLTRIRDEDLAEKPTFTDLEPEITEHIGDSAFIVGQNIQFDIRMLKGEGIDLSERKQLDTSMLASLVFPELASYSLPYMSAVLELDHTPIHRALGDVRATLELLSKCWERLHELDTVMYQQLQTVMQRAPEAYQELFALIPEPTNQFQPGWLTQRPDAQGQSVPVDTQSLEQPEALQLVGVPLSASVVRPIIQGALEQGQRTIVAVKNAHITAKSLIDLDSVQLIEPPSFLLNPAQVEPLIKQESFTTDEATLAVKLQWYTPNTKADIPLHGGEKDIWKARLACTDTNEEYQQQFAAPATVKLVNHWQLLRSIDASRSQSALLEHLLNTHIVIDDATSLEDTATKAFGWYCDCHTLRVASENSAELRSFADVLQMWVERVRSGQNQFYLKSEAISASEVQELRTQITVLLELSVVQESAGVQAQLEDLARMLDPTSLTERIMWIELGRDDRQLIQSVPRRLAHQLQQQLYDRFPVSLLVPPGKQQLQEIVPSTIIIAQADLSMPTPIKLHYVEDRKADNIFTDVPTGKTVLIVSGRKRIEDIFVRYAEELEQQGTTLLCQGFNGGTNRIQAEFLAQTGPTILVLSGFLFEVIDLPPNTIHQLFIESLPFDHPNHAVVSQRAEQYQNAFMEYSLARCEHRLYRILQVLSRSCAPGADATLLDNRISTKKYGSHVWEFLQATLDNSVQPQQSTDITSADTQNQQRPEGWQLEMF